MASPPLRRSEPAIQADFERYLEVSSVGVSVANREGLVVVVGRSSMSDERRRWRRPAGWDRAAAVH
jgi:hypothetical protein